MTDKTKEVFAKAVVTILKPLLKVLIGNEMTHAEFSELAKRAYVDVAYEHFSIPNRKTTFSRVAVLTGLSRKEVVRLNGLREDSKLLQKTSPNRAQRVVNGWLRDEEFIDENGQPLVLPLQGERASFAALVARYSGDITLGAVVDELQRTGVVERNNDKIELKKLGYLPQESEVQKIRIMSVCVADQLETSVFNILNEEDQARFQRQIIYRNMPQQLVEEFKQYSAKKSALLLQDFNRFLSRKKADTKQNSNQSEEKGKRVGLGIYYVESNHKDTESVGSKRND